MTPPETDLNPMSVAVLLLTVFGVGPEVAEALGAYGWIVVAWFAGAMLGLWRRPPALKIGVGGFVIVTFIVTLGFTVPASTELARYIGFVQAKSLFIFVAFAIPAVGHQWLDLAEWLWGLLRRRAERRADQP